MVLVKGADVAPGPPGYRCPGIDTHPRETRARSSGAVGHRGGSIAGILHHSGVAPAPRRPARSSEWFLLGRQLCAQVDQPSTVVPWLFLPVRCLYTERYTFHLLEGQEQCFTLSKKTLQVYRSIARSMIRSVNPKLSRRDFVQCMLLSRRPSSRIHRWLPNVWCSTREVWHPVWSKPISSLERIVSERRMSASP